MNILNLLFVFVFVLLSAQSSRAESGLNAGAKMEADPTCETGTCKTPIASGSADQNICQTDSVKSGLATEIKERCGKSGGKTVPDGTGTTSSSTSK